MKVKMHPKHRQGYIAGSIDWKTAYPFFLNPRGILVHRVRAVTTHLRDGKVSHYSVRYWCGNLTCFHDKGALLETPPKDRLLCIWCEVKATSARERSSDKLAGRHVHRGKCVAVRTCCEHLNHN